MDLPKQSVPITAKLVSSNNVHGDVPVYSIHYVINLSVNKTDRHDMTEISLKAAQNTINLSSPIFEYVQTFITEYQPEITIKIIYSTIIMYLNYFYFQYRMKSFCNL